MDFIEIDRAADALMRHGETFIRSFCRLSGSPENVSAGTGKMDVRFINDLRFYAFTKSTKSMRSVRALQQLGQNEDVFILSRSMLENYLASRFIDETFSPETQRDLILLPLAIAQREVLRDKDRYFSRDTREEVDYIERNPASMTIGRERTYFYSLYSYLCEFAHCNFSQVSSLLDENKAFTVEKNVHADLARLFPLFIYAKIFESVVLLEQTRFETEEEETACCELIRQIDTLLYRLLSEMRADWSDGRTSDESKHMRKLFLNMRNSLREQLGRVSKEFLAETGA